MIIIYISSNSHKFLGTINNHAFVFIFVYIILTWGGHRCHRPSGLRVWPLRYLASPETYVFSDLYPLRTAPLVIVE